MHMSFWHGTSIGDLLFKGYTITSTAGFLATCLGLASLAMLFEALRVYQAALKEKAVAKSTSVQSSCCPNERSALIAKDQENGGRKNWRTILGHASLFLMEMLISYLLMLCVMTFNVYLLLAVSLGGTMGYFLFGPVLQEIGVRSGGFHLARVPCLQCKERRRKQQELLLQQQLQQQQQQLVDGGPQSSSIMSEVAQGLANSMMADSGDRQLCCAVAEVHQ